MDDVSLYDDSRVGAAARVVHFGCRDVLQEHFKLTPIADAEEGSQVTIPENYSVDEYRLMGKIRETRPLRDFWCTRVGRRNPSNCLASSRLARSFSRASLPPWSR